MIEDKVNMILGEIFKIFGPVVFKSILGQGKAAGGGTSDSSKSNNEGSTVNVKNPFDDDDDSGITSFVDDDDFFNKPASTSSSDSADNGNKITFELPTIKPDSEPSSSAIPDDTTLPDTENITANSVQW